MQGRYHTPSIGERHQVSHLPPLPPPSGLGTRFARKPPHPAAAAAAGVAALVNTSRGSSSTPLSSTLSSPSPDDTLARAASDSSKGDEKSCEAAKLPPTQSLPSQDTVEEGSSAAGMGTATAGTVVLPAPLSAGMGDVLSRGMAINHDEPGSDDAAERILSPLPKTHVLTPSRAELSAPAAAPVVEPGSAPATSLNAGTEAIRAGVIEDAQVSAEKNSRSSEMLSSVEVNSLRALGLAPGKGATGMQGLDPATDGSKSRVQTEPVLDQAMEDTTTTESVGLSSVVSEEADEEDRNLNLVIGLRQQEEQQQPSPMDVIMDTRPCTSPSSSLSSLSPPILTSTFAENGEDDEQKSLSATSPRQCRGGGGQDDDVTLPAVVSPNPGEPRRLCPLEGLMMRGDKQASLGGGRSALQEVATVGVAGASSSAPKSSLEPGHAVVKIKQLPGSLPQPTTTTSTAVTKDIAPTIADTVGAGTRSGGRSEGLDSSGHSRGSSGKLASEEGGGITKDNHTIPPDLSFDDVAELVWDPRAGSKPRGMVEASRGRPGRGDDERLALERAMWDRDSALLARVAPAYAEKAMQVLQMHRHDVERAAQMLTVRHGIPVVGLSSVRKTRNASAEQQAVAASARPGWPLGRLCWRDGQGGGGGTGGTGSGGGASGAAGGGKTDAQGVTREEAKAANDAFMRHGRDLNAVTKALGWKKSRVVEYYYGVWKFSPGYQVTEKM